MAVIDTQDLLAMLAVGATLQEVADWAIAQPESAAIPLAWHYHDHNPLLAESANAFTTDPNTAAAMGGRPLYLHPPVDLGQFREAVRVAWQKAAAGSNIDLQFGQLLALIDSQA